MEKPNSRKRGRPRGKKSPKQKERIKKVLKKRERAEIAQAFIADALLKKISELHNDAKKALVEKSKELQKLITEHAELEVKQKSTRMKITALEKEVAKYQEIVKHLDMQPIKK